MQNLITGLILISISIVLYLTLFKKNNTEKIKKSLKKSIKIFIQNSVRIFLIFLIIGMLQSFLSKDSVGNFLLKFQGIKGVILGELTGSIMMGPVASGYPIAKYLFDNGAEVSLISAFLLSWVLIGFVSVSIEFKELGKRFALVRNIITLISIIIISMIMGIVLWKRKLNSS